MLTYNELSLEETAKILLVVNPLSIWTSQMNPLRACIRDMKETAEITFLSKYNDSTWVTTGGYFLTRSLVNEEGNYEVTASLWPHIIQSFLNKNGFLPK